MHSMVKVSYQWYKIRPNYDFGDEMMKMFFVSWHNKDENDTIVIII